MSRSWHGDELMARTDRAIGRAAVGLGVQMAAEMQKVAHVITGDLRNSIHAAAADNAEGVPDATTENVLQSFAATVEVGSWLPYACVEENHGGDHRFATRGYEAAHGRGVLLIEKALAEEGL